MDDRDKDLTHLFVRDLDEIPLPPSGDWRRHKGRESTAMRASRYFLTAGAIVAVIAIALIVGFQLNERQQTAAGPSSSPRSSTTGLPNVAASASPIGTACPLPNTSCGATGATAPTGVGIFNDDFGFIATDYGGFTADVRTESGAQRQGLQGLSFSSQGLAVSADGKYVAYWTLGTSSQPSQLRTFTTLGNATEQTLVTLATGQRAGGIVWSSDGAAILYSIDTGCSICGGPVGATLNIYELAAGGRHGTAIDTQANKGWYRPIAWDRSANIAAAGLLGEGGGMISYVTIRMNPDNTVSTQRTGMSTSANLGIMMQSVRASTDAKFVLGVDFESGDITWWPLADFAANRSQAAAVKRGVLWRPGTHEIGFLSGDQFWLGDVNRLGPRGLCCTAFSGAPASSTVRTFRADGTAVVLGVSTQGSTGIGVTDYTLVRLGSDPNSTSGDRVTFQEIRGLAASIRLR